MTQLALASSSLLDAKEKKVLRITMAPTFAHWWFAPRLERFVAQFPELAIDIWASTALSDFSLGQYDLAIRYSKRLQSGLHAIPLGKNEAFPVCSPQLLKAPHALRKPADLQRHTLISTRDDLLVDEPKGNWAGWLRSTNNAHVAGARHLHLTPRGLMLTAVVRGLGVGMGRTLLVAEAMRAREIVCPFGPSLALAGDYYFICPEAISTDPDIVAFRDWLLSEARASAAASRLPRGLRM